MTLGKKRMPKFKPIHGAVLLVAFAAALIWIDGGFKSPHKQVPAGPDGIVRIGVGDLGRALVRRGPPA